METLTTQIEAETNIMLEQIKLSLVCERARILGQAQALKYRNPFLATQMLDIYDDINKTLSSIKKVEDRIEVFGVR